MSNEYWNNCWPWSAAFSDRRSRPSGAGSWPWAAAFGFNNRQRFFETGELRLAILSLLSEGPKHGYQLMKEMEDRSGGMYRASAGSVYPTLQQLEDEGLIQSDQQSGKRVYTLTEAGRKELAGDPETVRRIWERAEQCEDWGKYMGPDAWMVFPAFGPLIKSGLRAARRSGGGVDRVREVLDRARRELDAL